MDDFDPPLTPAEKIAFADIIDPDGGISYAADWGPEFFEAAPKTEEKETPVPAH